MSIFNTDTDFLDEIRQYVPAIHRNMAWESVLPYEQSAIQWLVDMNLGLSAAFFTALETPPGTPPASWPQVSEKAKTCISWYIAFRLLQAGSVSITDMGNIIETNPETAQASDQAARTATWSALRNAHDMAEYLVWNLLLPDHGDYSGLGFDPAPAVEYLLHSPAQLSQHQHLPPSGRLEVFCALRPYMKKVEMIHLRKLICPDFFAEFQAKLQDSLTGGDALTDLEAKLAWYLREISSEYSYRMALPYLNTMLTKAGGRVKDLPGYSESIFNKHNDLEYLDLALESNRSALVRDLLEFLLENQDTFETWRDGRCHPDYTPPEDPSAPCPDPDTTNLVVHSGGGVAF